jgi:hypothetical protein
VMAKETEKATGMVTEWVVRGLERQRDLRAIAADRR